MNIQSLFRLTCVSLLVACSAPAPSPPEQQGQVQLALTGLVASYSFDEGSGTTAADGSGNRNTGTLSGATWTKAGKYGGALSFNGAAKNQKLDVPDSNSLDLGSAWTIAAWIKPTTNVGWSTVVLKERPPVTSFGLSYALYSSGDTTAPWAGLTNSAGHNVNGGGTTANVWQHLAVTSDGTTLRLYKDGAQTATASAGGAPTATTAPLRIGGNTMWGEWFSGLIDEVQIYGRALSAAEIVTVRDTPLGSSGAGGGGGAGGSSGAAGAGGAGGSSAAAGTSGSGGSSGAAGGAAGTSGSGSAGSSGASAQIQVDGATTYQTIDGFGAAINAHSWDAGAAASALDQLDTMGVKTWRVVYEMTDWEATNDNADPATFNWTSYNALFTSPAFEELWSTIGYLNSKGHNSGVVLNFMGRVPPWMGGATLNTSLKDEFVETVVAVAYYGRVTRGLQFGQFEPLNESDWDGFEGTQVGASDYGDIMNRIAVRLDALGLSDLKLVGPDCAQSSVGLGSYLPAMASHPALMAHVDTFTIHQYSASSAGLMAAIAASAYPTKHGWVSETDSIFSAWAQVSEGANSVLLWEGFDSVYNHAILAGRGSTAPNDSGQNMGLANAPLAYSSAGGGTYTKRDTYYQWEQLFRFVAPGAQRIAASTSVSGTSVLAFRHPGTGQLAIVGRNDTGSGKTLSLSLAGLGSVPATLDLYLSNQDAGFVHSTVPVSGGRASFTVTYNSVWTLTAGTSPDTTPPAITLQTLTLQVGASDAVGVAGVQFSVDGVNVGAEVTTAPYAAAWPMVSGSHVLSARARDAAGNTSTKSTTVVVP